MLAGNERFVRGQSERNHGSLTHRRMMLSRGQHPEALERHAGRANVLAAAAKLRYGSEILERLALGGKLLVVGAEYDLATGVVDVFDGI